MKRRLLGLLAGTSMAVLKFSCSKAQAVIDTSLLTTTLTPYGAERAGNADGSIPAWTGGYTTIPAGWEPGKAMPDFFADEQPTVVVDTSNMDQHSDKLSLGVIAMMKQYGFKIKVYPTHRTFAAPQYVYDNVAKNALTAKLNPGGGRLGFSGAFGGIPFPFPDFSDPLAAGAQIMWNHNVRWAGNNVVENNYGYAVSDGEISLSSAVALQINYPYYDKDGSVADYKDYFNRQFISFIGPSNRVGEQILQWASSDPYNVPTQTWELLNGQSRVRKAPEISFDTPASETNGISGYDEYYGFSGSIEQYDWKYVGKKELYIPYNNNGTYLLKAEDVHLPHFWDPEAVRWELHRVYVVEATVHPGERNVLARRTFYLDEDTWIVAAVDEYDANNNLFKVDLVYNYLRPDLPGLLQSNNTVNNLQTNDYTSGVGLWDQNNHPSFRFADEISGSVFDPQSMAASSQY